MKYTLNINQKIIIESGLKLDLQDACIIDFLYAFSLSPKIEKKLLDNKVYCWFKYSHITENLPLLNMKKDSVYRRIKDMTVLGLMEPHPDNQILGKSFFHLTDKLIGLYFKFDPTDENPYPSVSKSVPPTDINPNNKNINNNNNSLHKSKESDLPFSEEDLKRKRKKFIPPTLQEVQLIIKDKKRAQKFINHYQGNGWIVGRVKMVDWQATANNWVLDEEEKSSNQAQGQTSQIIF